MRRALFVLLAFGLLTGEAQARRQHVRGYTRSNGTYVRGYTREIADASPEAILALLVIIVILVICAFIAESSKNSSPHAYTYNRPAPASRVPRPPQGPSPLLPLQRVLTKSFKVIIHSVLRFSSFTWISQMPDWLQPILWVLAFSLIPVSTVFRLRSSGSLILDTLLVLGFIISGCASGGLVFDAYQAVKVQRNQRRLVRLTRFKTELRRELRERPVKDFNFDRIVVATGVDRSEADAVADYLYRHLSDKVVADGIITKEERRNLNRLGRMLALTPDRIASIESQAKAVLYHTTVSEVLEDGVVTDEEWKRLESLVRSLEVSATDQQKADEKIRTITTLDSLNWE